MEQAFIHLRILLPYKVFLDMEEVSRLVVETSCGSYGFLPNRLDCFALLVPGILELETTGGEITYYALDEGLFVKSGKDIRISVRNAVGGASLGELKNSVDQIFKNISEEERSIRQVMSKLESRFIEKMETIQSS